MYRIYSGLKKRFSIYLDILIGDVVSTISSINTDGYGQILTAHLNNRYHSKEDILNNGYHSKEEILGT